MRVFVVGSTNVDRTVAVDRLPAAGETVLGDAIVVSAGGKGANAAVAAARAQAQVTFVSAVGDDGDGRFVLEQLRAEGVSVDAVRVLTDAVTGGALIITDGAGENVIAVGAGANGRLAADAVIASLRQVGRGDVVLVNAEIPDACIEEALRCGGERGAQVVFDPAPARQAMIRWADLGPIFTPNESEAATLTGCSGAWDAARLLSTRSGRPAIVTRGSAGCLIADGEEVSERPAAAVEGAIVDSVGAGDTFAGALAAALARGDGLPDAVDAALAAAAQSLGWAGARPPRRAG